MLLLGQTKFVVNSLDDQLPGVQLDHGTVLERVVRSDSRRERALKEFGSASISQKSIILLTPAGLDLSDALDNADNPLAVVRAVRKLKHDRLERKLSEMREIADRRSGARGAKSRKDLISLEEQVVNSKLRHVIVDCNYFMTLTITLKTRAIRSRYRPRHNTG
jgi:hypothetical protein